MTPTEEKLALLEQGHAEAEAALAALKADWAREDRETAGRRAVLLEAHAQGERDRDAVRVKLGGGSLIEAQKRENAKVEAKNKEVEVARRVEADTIEAADERAKPSGPKNKS